MEDKFTRGFVAGIIGAVFAGVFSFTSCMMGFTTLRTADWIAIFIYAHTPPFATAVIIYSTLGQLALGGVKEASRGR